MDFSSLLLVAILVWAFSLFSARTEGTPITAPMVFTAMGLAMGPAALGWIDVGEEGGLLHTLAEATLVLVLFGDAARIPLASVRKALALPVRLLGIGLPLAMAAGGLLAKLLLPELGWFEALALGALLAPTDAALGQAVVSDTRVPNRIRQALNVESGLNDGIALPFVLVFASLASMGHGEARSTEAWVEFALLQVTLGPLMGVLVAGIGGRALGYATGRGWVGESFERISGLALALGCFAAAEWVGGNGFIAAFVGGMTFGNLMQQRCAGLFTFMEAEGQLLMLIVFLLFGAGYVAQAWGALDLRGFSFVLASLTVARMLPVSLSLLGTGLRAPTHLFVGWFGPRGIATILYGLLVVEEAQLPHEGLVVALAMATASASVLLHGLSAAPGATLYAGMAANAGSCPAEHAHAPSMPLRFRSGPRVSAQ